MAAGFPKTSYVDIDFEQAARAVQKQHALTGIDRSEAIMVRLSPKALRFAEEALHGLDDASQPKQIWENWSTDRRIRASLSGRGFDEGYVIIPDAVAEVLFAAVEQRIGQMAQELERDGEADPDLGNDIAFLRAVSGTLRAELRHASEVEF